MNERLNGEPLEEVNRSLEDIKGMWYIIVPMEREAYDVGSSVLTNKGLELKEMKSVSESNCTNGVVSGRDLGYEKCREKKTECVEGEMSEKYDGVEVTQMNRARNDEVR